MEGQASYLADWQALGDAASAIGYLERALAATPGEVTDAVRRYLDLSGVRDRVRLSVGESRRSQRRPARCSPRRLRPPDPLRAAAACGRRGCGGRCGCGGCADTARVRVRPGRAKSRVRAVTGCGRCPILVTHKPGAQIDACRRPRARRSAPTRPQRVPARQRSWRAPRSKGRAPGHRTQLVDARRDAGWQHRP